MSERYLTDEELAALERRFENVACARCDFSQDVPCVCPDYHTLGMDAGAEIRALVAEVRRLREALATIAEYECVDCLGEQPCKHPQWLQDWAADALLPPPLLAKTPQQPPKEPR